MKNVLLLAIFMIGLTSFAQDESLNAPQIGVSIPLGEAIVIEGISIAFVEVMEDSRCPKDVTCVWAGQAKVKLLVTQEGQATEEKEILFGRTSNTLIGTTDNFIIDALSLTPYPTAATQGKLAYVLLVKKAEKKED